MHTPFWFPSCKWGKQRTSVSLRRKLFLTDNDSWRTYRWNSSILPSLAHTGRCWGPCSGHERSFLHSELETRKQEQVSPVKKTLKNSHELKSENLPFHFHFPITELESVGLKSNLKYKIRTCYSPSWDFCKIYVKEHGLSLFKIALNHFIATF